MDFKILIADDSTLVRNNIKRLLGGIKNLDIFESKNVESSLNSIQKIKPDILLLDLRMPDGNGLDVLKSLNEKQCDKPVTIVMTNNSDPEIKNICLNEGADYFYDKSNEHKTAIDLIKKIVSDALEIKNSRANITGDGNDDES